MVRGDAQSTTAGIGANRSTSPARDQLAKVREVDGDVRASMRCAANVLLWQC